MEDDVHPGLVPRGRQPIDLLSHCIVQDQLMYWAA